jgi:hypothetical protein
MDRITLFHGRNETGKTTIFDAIFTELCKPKASKKQGRRIRKRYGDNTEVEVVFSGQPVTIDEDEFLNLYAVHSGNMNLELKSNSSWTEKIKADLFTGGIDPAKIIRELANLASTSNTLKHNKELNSLKSKKKVIQGELAGLKEKERSLLQRELRFNEKKKNLSLREKDLGTLKMETVALQQELAAAGLIREKQELVRLLLKIKSSFAGREKLASLKGCSHEELKKLDAFQKDLAGISSLLLQGEAEEKHLLQAVEHGDERPCAGEQPADQGNRPGVGFIGAAILVFLAGAGGVIFISDLLMRIASGVTGLLLAFIFLLLGAGKSKRLYGREPDRNRSKFREHLEQKRRKNEELRGEALSKSGAIADWLKERRVQSRDEYLKLIFEREELSSKQERLTLELRQELKRRGLEDLRLLALEVERRLNAFDQQGVANSGKGEAEVRGLQKELETKQAQLEELNSEYSDLKAAVAEEMGGISASFGSLPPEIGAKELLLRENLEAQQQIELDREAAGLAENIFSEIARDSGRNFSELSGDITGLLKEILPDRNEVEMLKLNEGAVMVVDGGGGKRSLEHLSAGTKDSFLLAARLALAGRCWGRGGILLIDEPFQAMDRVRMERALRLIKKFIEQNGWQVIIFSKEEELMNQAKRLFPGIKVQLLDN